MSKHKKPITVSYYCFTPRTNKIKARLATVLDQVNHEFCDTMRNLPAWSKDGGFENFANALIKDALLHLVDYDEHTKQITMYARPDAGINNLGDIAAMIKATPDINIASSKQTYQIDLRTLFVTKLHLPLECLEWPQHDTRWEDLWVNVAAYDQTDVTDLVPPESDYDILLENTENLPNEKLVHHYVKSDCKTFQAAKKLDERINKEIPELLWPTNESLKSYLLGLIFPRFRTTILKRSPSGRPSIYAPIISLCLQSLSMLTDGENVIEEWKHDEFIEVKEPTELLDVVLHEAEVDNEQADNHIPLSEHLNYFDSDIELFQTPVFFNELNAYDPAKKEQQAKYTIDVVSMEETIFDDEGNRVLDPDELTLD